MSDEWIQDPSDQIKLHPTGPAEGPITVTTLADIRDDDTHTWVGTPPIPAVAPDDMVIGRRYVIAVDHEPGEMYVTGTYVGPGAVDPDAPYAFRRWFADVEVEANGFEMHEVPE